ncbi:uncharacterized protein LOC144129226 [Amblyomma americanum]
MDEFFPKDYTDHESDVEDDFPVYTLSRHWKEELQLDKPETQAQRRARRVMRPARRATGVHIINPDPTHMNSADTRVYDTNLFLEIKLSWRPGGARVNFIKGEQVVFAVEFKDYNATSDKDRYDQPEPDLALVLHHLDSNKKLVQYEVDRKTFKPEELHTYSFNVRQRASSVKISVNETELAKVSIFEQLTETQISSTEGLEVMALHQPCRLEKPFTTTIVPELGVGERIVLFGTFELTDCDHKKLLTIGNTTVPWPENVKYKKKTRITIQRYKTQLVVYYHTAPFFKSRQVDFENVGGKLELCPAFNLVGLWIERMKKL